MHCMADTDTLPTQSMSELDVSCLTSTLLAAVIDLQVTGARNGDEKKLAAELYTKLTAMFDQSSEKLCDCLLFCRCLIYKKHRKPRVLIPLIRRVLFRGGGSHSSLRCVTGTHYIKLLLLAKMWLFMVDAKEVPGVRSLVAGALKIPEFFTSWLDQNDILWLRGVDKNPLKVKKILKCMTVSEVLETLYGANKITCEIKQTEMNVPQVKKEEMEIKDLSTKTKKKKKKRTLTDEEKIEDIQPSNKKLKKSSSVEAQSNILEVANKKPKKEKIDSLTDKSRELIQNDDVKKEEKKRKKKKKDKIKDNLNSNTELNGGMKTDENLENLVNGSSLKKKKQKDKKSKGEKKNSENCESSIDNSINLNEIVNKDPIENVNGELKKKKKNKNKSDKNIDSSVELTDEKLIKKISDNENEVISETLKKKKIKLDKSNAEDNVNRNESVENLIPSVLKSSVLADNSVTEEILENEKPCENNKEIANNVSEDRLILDTQQKDEFTSVKKDKTPTGWNVSPTNMSNKKKKNQVVEQGNDNIENPKKSNCTNKELVDCEDMSSSTILDSTQQRGRSRKLETPTQTRDRSISKGRRIFTPESAKRSTSSDRQREIKVSGSTPELQKERKNSLSKEDIISYRKRVRRDSLTFTVTHLTEDDMVLLKEKENEKGCMILEKESCVEKVSLGIQTDVSSLNESGGDLKVMKPNTEPPIKPGEEIDKDYKVLKPKLDSPGSYKVLKPKTELMNKTNSLEEQSREIQEVLQIETSLKQNEIYKSQEILKVDHSSNQNANDESDSDIEVMEEVIVVNVSSKTPKEVECNMSDDIDEASGTESDIVPCDDSKKMFTDIENQVYHEKLKEQERKRKEAEMDRVVQEVLKKDEKIVQERMKRLSETEKGGTKPEKIITKTNNKKADTAEIDSNQILSKLYNNDANKNLSKEVEKESVSNNEEIHDNEDIEVVLQTIVSDTGRVESILGLREELTNTGEAETNKENVEPNENDSEVQIVEEKAVANENEIETQSSNYDIVADICEFKENMSEKELKNNTRPLNESNSKTNDVTLLDTNQELCSDIKEKETMEPITITGNDSGSNREKISEKSVLKDANEKKSTHINTNNNNSVEKVLEVINDNAKEKDVNNSKAEADKELAQSKLSTEDVCTTQKEAKGELSDQDVAYEASSDASEEQPRTPTHAIRKKMSERKRRALATVHITSDSDMSPVRATQRGIRSAEKSKHRKKDNIQSTSVIHSGTLDESVASVSLLQNINDSSLESIFSSTSILTTEEQTDGSCATVIPAPAAAIISNNKKSDIVQESMQTGNSESLENKNDSSLVSEDPCDNSKTALDGDKTIVAETMSSDITEDLIEEEGNTQDAQSLTNYKENNDSLLLMKDRVDIDEDEELEVLSTSEVDDDDGEEHVSTSPRLTRSKNTLSASETVSLKGSGSVSLKSPTRRRRSSQTREKIVGESMEKPVSPAFVPQSQRLAAQALHKELIISPDVSDEECELVSPEVTEEQQKQAVEASSNSEAEDGISEDGITSKQAIVKNNSLGLHGVRSGRIRSPQKMIPEEQDETQPKLTRSRQQQLKVSDLSSFSSSKGDKTSPKLRTRSRSNSFTGVGPKNINTTPTKGTNQNEIPKLNRRKSTSYKNDNSLLKSIDSIETKKDEEIVETVEIKRKRGRPRNSDKILSPSKNAESKTGTQLASPDLFTSPKSREESEEKLPRRNTRRSILLVEDALPVTRSPRFRRAALVGENEEKPTTPRMRYVSDSEVSQTNSPRRSSRRSIGSGAQSADESIAVQKISVGQRRQSLAPLREEGVGEDKSETQKRKTRVSISTPRLSAKGLPQTRGSRTPAATPTGAKNQAASKGAKDTPESAPGIETSRSIRPRRSIHSFK
ncbi:unnamed protein product [Meganyctiphanes norvegica]|uniref:Uncharacterized protein n=1 Tax=Meganyctiphanes norvegica TaxID=48144 RepID=A0AAV2QIQ9_MEGNR